MIGWLKRWIGRTAEQYNGKLNAVPSVVAHTSPTVTVYKITNGYLVHRVKDGSPYRDVDGVTIVYCATPMEVARQFIGDEALKKMGVQREPQSGAVSALNTSGIASGSFQGVGVGPQSV